MKQLSMIAALLAVFSLTLPGMAGDPHGEGGQCVCSSGAVHTVSWCSPCSVGSAFGHKTKSQKLVQALSGKEVDSSKIKCAGCKTALQDSGSCDHCNVSFAKGQAFHSPVAVALTRGEVVDAKDVHCPGCRTNVEKGRGQCSHCNVSVLNGAVYKSKDDYVAARKATTVLAKAVKTADKCEGCAVAMVSDGKCEHCNVSFEGGKKAKTSGSY